MKRKFLDIGHDSSGLTTPDTQIHSAKLVRVEELGLSMPQGGPQVSGTAILVQATQHLLDISRRDGGMLHRFGVISSETTGAQFVLVYVLADAELHLLVLTGADPEVMGFLGDARKSGKLNVLWVAPTGDSRFSPLPLDESVALILGRAEHNTIPDPLLLSMYEVGWVVKRALSHDVLRQVGVEPSTLRAQLVHCLATSSMLDKLGQLAQSMTKH